MLAATKTGGRRRRSDQPGREVGSRVLTLTAAEKLQHQAVLALASTAQKLKEALELTKGSERHSTALNEDLTAQRAVLDLLPEGNAYRTGLSNEIGAMEADLAETKTKLKEAGPEIARLRAAAREAAAFHKAVFKAHPEKKTK